MSFFSQKNSFGIPRFDAAVTRKAFAQITQEDRKVLLWVIGRARSVATKGVRSSVDGKCRYRGQAGACCFVGAAISDKRYSADIEERSVSHRDVFRALLASYADDQRKAVTVQRGVDQEVAVFPVTRLLKIIQSCHDNAPIEDWLSILDGMERELTALSE